MMKAAHLIGTKKIIIEDIEKPQIQKDDDVIIKVVRTCVCGSDMWFYRGIEKMEPGWRNTGHEVIGVVKEVGPAITTVQPGDFVIAACTHGCGHCAACEAGYDGSCQKHPYNFSDNYHAEYIRYAHGQWALVKIPGKPKDYSEGMLKSLLTLADVMATGYHAARTANVQQGDTVVVMGDGAVGLCGIIAAKLRGAKQIISTSSHRDRLELIRELGATDNVAARGDQAVKQIMGLTHGQGADAILECVGTEESIETALEVGRPGSTVGRVGLPHSPKMDMATSFNVNKIIAGGPVSATTYARLLLPAVLSGQINPGKVFTKEYSFNNIAQAYADMESHQEIKSYVKM